MEDREYETMAEVEDRHFWFVGTRGIVRDAFMAAKTPPNPNVLDMGCGTGGTMKALADLGRFTGLDVNEKAAQFARQRTGNQVLTGSATDLPFATDLFDVVLSLDVFEHIEDHDRAVSEVRRVLKPGGLMIATVPCHPALYSEHDRALHHVRRYRRGEFEALLQRNGFTIDRITWTNSLLFPIAAGHRLVSRGLPAKTNASSDAATNLGVLNGVFNAVFKLERRILRKINMPMGLGLLVVAR